MIRNSTTSFIIYILLAISIPALGRDNKDELIHLQADSIQYNFKRGQILYEGHVHATRNLTQLYADKMTVFYKQRKIDKILAQGKPAYFATQAQADKDILHAYASNIIYFPRIAKVELIQNVKVRQRDNEFTGPKLFYDMKSQRVLSLANKKSKAQLVIEPIDNLKK